MYVESDFEASEMHDSRVCSFVRQGDNVTITFANLSMDVDEEEYYTVIVRLGGVSNVTRDDKPLADVGVLGRAVQR